jgi:hypothetical protein
MLGAGGDDVIQISDADAAATVCHVLTLDIASFLFVKRIHLKASLGRVDHDRHQVRDPSIPHEGPG